MNSAESTTGETGEHEAPTPESLRGTLLTLIVLALIFSTAIAFGGLYLQRGDTKQLFDEVFGADATLPYGFERSGGTAVAGDQRWTRMTRPDSAPPAPAGSTLPEAVMVGRFSAPPTAERLFEDGTQLAGRRLSERLEEWREDPNQSLQGLIARGPITFGALEADFVHLRMYHQGGGFHDVVRVNVSTDDYGQVLAAHWPEGVEDVDEELLVPFLERLQLGGESSD